VPVEKLQLPAVRIIYVLAYFFDPHTTPHVHWKFKPFMNSELQFGPVLLYYRTTVLSHSSVGILYFTKLAGRIKISLGSIRFAESIRID